jgi:valyl-tRNA synthetase
VELLGSAGALIGSPVPITHPVKFYEKGDRPLEIVASRQWYIRNGGRDPELRDALLARGKALQWHPAFMYQRYESWVEGLNGDWLISRQRYFGVPFPLWYPVLANGEIDYDHPLAPSSGDLPVDPSSDVPAGFSEAQRGAPGGFVGDPDVMDTWATSSLSPQIATGWVDDPDLFGRTFPMDLRPQGPEIIRTWLFDSIVRAHFEHDSLPWAHASLNGWILDPDRKKMSKSKGNAVTPIDVLSQYGSDAVRYWACSARPGTDTAIDVNQFKIGRRLAIKLLNASKFVLGLSGAGDGGGLGLDAVVEPLDLALLTRLRSLVEGATTAFEGYDYARALERTESFFWAFCDDYVELVKSRAYGTLGDDRAVSAQATLRAALSAVLRLLAPFLPFVTEEVWSWWQEGSVHRATWPVGSLDAGGGASGDGAVLDDISWALGQIRSAKSGAGKSMRWPVTRATVIAPPERITRIRSGADDLREAGTVASLVFEPAVAGTEDSVVVELAAAAS